MQESTNPFVWPGAIAGRWQKKRPECGLASCSSTRSLWQRMWRRPAGALVQGVYYCQPECITDALTAVLTQLERLAPASPPVSRIPLGLLMVARGRLTYTEVVAALDAQRRARHGTIGEWFEKLGFATEQEVTSALGLQWGCPVASSLEVAAISPFVEIPFPILDSLCMLPLQYAVGTRTLYLACGQRVDHAALYAIDKMVDCRTQACVGGRKSIVRQLERLRQQPRPREVEFGPVHDIAEMIRIGLSYITRMGAEDVRVGRVGTMIWLRLKTQSSYTNLVFRLRAEVQHSMGRPPNFWENTSWTQSKPSTL